MQDSQFWYFCLMETKTMRVHFIAAGGTLMQNNAGDQARDKLRIVIGGSHGKTTVAAMIIHVFRHNSIPFDYIAGSAKDVYGTTAGTGSDSRADLAVNNGITRVQTDDLPARENCLEQYTWFASTVMPGGSLLYNVNDPQAAEVAAHSREDIRKIPYDIHGYMVNKAGCYAVTINRMVKVDFCGEHNMQNLSAAREVCLAAGLTEDQFYAAIGSGFSIPECNPSQKNLLI
jgi:UDP-N-acetylmuramate: L-alanyl-gamma-D-glutamyl-meso-diaminopimelate ligase